MTTAALLAARDAGCTRAVLQASADGLRIYERPGFRTCGTITESKRPVA